MCLASLNMLATFCQHILSLRFTNFPLSLGTLSISEGAVDGCIDQNANLLCHENADCLDEPEGESQCVCRDGYIGDGYTSCTGMFFNVHLNIWTHL